MITDQVILHLYRSMLLIREVEESLLEPIANGDVRCPVHLCCGQEAVAVGVLAHLAERDYVFGNHRSHGHYLAKGCDLKRLVAEVYCRADGCSKGRGGSMHLYGVERGFLGGAPIVAGTVSLAVGAALAAVARFENRVAVAFFGDGATSEGVVCESMNLAALRRLPVIFVCENNYYATHMPVQECRPDVPITRLADAFGIANTTVDGNDALAVFHAAEEAVLACRSGRGPYFLECSTYRLRGHVGPDDNIQGLHTDIRPAAELARWRSLDPILRLREHLLRCDLLSVSEDRNMRDEISREVAAAHSHARQSPFPAKESIADYVFGT